MNRSWEIACLACTYDLEDKLGLSSVEPLCDQPLVICQIELCESDSYQPPRSTIAQAQICRFMQEAIMAQFHLSKLSDPQLSRARLERALKLASQQLDFFLKSHQWHARLHALVLMPPGNDPSKPPHSIQLLCVGQPPLYLYSTKTQELKPLLQQRPYRCFGDSYPFTYEPLSLELEPFERLLLSSTGWQQVRPTRVQQLLEANWLDLPQQLLSALDDDELDNSPFFIIQLMSPMRPWKQWVCKTLQSWQNQLSRLVAHPAKAPSTP